MRDIRLSSLEHELDTVRTIYNDAWSENWGFVPLTPEEIADSTAEAYKAGASILHLHVRDENGKATQRLDVFKKTIDLVRKKCDIVIEVSTGGAVGDTPEERLQPVTLEPDMWGT